MSKSRCITTPIYYVNDRPHIGHVYTTTLCDAWARAMRLSGDEVFFLTGTDEHGVKVEQSARDKGLDPQALADLNSAEFRKAMELFDLTNDEFIRTTDPDHIRQVQLFVKKLIAVIFILANSKAGTTGGKKSTSPKIEPVNLTTKVPSVANRSNGKNSRTTTFGSARTKIDWKSYLPINQTLFDPKPGATRCWGESERVFKTFRSVGPTSLGVFRCLKTKSM